MYWYYAFLLVKVLWIYYWQRNYVYFIFVVIVVVKRNGYLGPFTGPMVTVVWDDINHQKQLSLILMETTLFYIRLCYLFIFSFYYCTFLTYVRYFRMPV